MSWCLHQAIRPRSGYSGLDPDKTLVKGPMKLNEQQVRDFFDRGWTVVPDVFQPDEMERARQAFQRLHATAQRLRSTQEHDGAYFVLDAPPVGDVIVKRVVWAGGAEPDLLALGADRRLLEPALDLLGSDHCEQLLCQAHFKMPGDGVSFDWHRDLQHRDKGNGTWRDVNGRGSYVQTITLIDDMGEANGPLLFIPGEAGFDTSKSVTLTGTAGSVLFFGPYTAHASMANDSASPRRVLINGYAYPGANGRVYPGREACRVLRR